MSAKLAQLSQLLDDSMEQFDSLFPKAQRRINKIPRALPEPIRARATEVLVFFGPARDEKSFACLV